MCRSNPRPHAILVVGWPQIHFPLQVARFQPSKHLSEPAAFPRTGLQIGSIQHLQRGKCLREVRIFVQAAAAYSYSD